MSISLDITATAASAHGNELSVAQESAMFQYFNPFMHPLQFLQDRFSAFTTNLSPLSPHSTASIHSAKPLEHSSTEDAVRVLDDVPASSSQSYGPVNSEISTRSVIRSKTLYYFAHPPPRSNNHHRLQGLPRMLLQLRRMADNGRASPMLEVFPATTFSRSLKKRLPRLANFQNGLGQDDFLILSCDSYHGKHSFERQSSAKELSEAEELDHRVLIATIRQCGINEDGPGIVAEILLGSTLWTVSRLKRGGYEFSSSNMPGEESKVRWTPRSRKSTRRQSLQASPEKAKVDRFGFSLVNPLGRRHPFAGYMDRSAIEILDQFTATGTALGGTSTREIAVGGRRDLDFATSRESSTNGEEQSGHCVVETSEETKTLALVTGIWVAISEGWLDAVRSYGDGGQSTSTPIEGPSNKGLFRSASATVSRPVGNRIPTDSSAGSNNSHVFRPSLASLSSINPGAAVRRSDSPSSMTNTVSSDGFQNDTRNAIALDSRYNSSGRKPITLSHATREPSTSSLKKSFDLMRPKTRRRMTFDGTNLGINSETPDKSSPTIRPKSFSSSQQLRTQLAGVEKVDSDGQNSKRRNKLLSFISSRKKDRH